MHSSIGIYYQLIVKDKNGKVVRKTRFKRSKSCVLQFLQILEVQIFATAVNITDTAGTPRSAVADDENFKSQAPVGDNDYGILVGTGTTPPDNLDVALQTKIAHGVGAGQLSHGASSKTTTAEVGANVDFILTRTFNNGSGGTINVTEAGIVSNYALNGGFNGLIIHDTFTAVVVTNGQTLTVNYTFRTTV